MQSKIFITINKCPFIIIAGVQMDYQFTDEQPWTKVSRPSKVIARINFPTKEELFEKRSDTYKLACEACNVLYFRLAPNANPPHMKLHVENQLDLEKLKEKLPNFIINETPQDETENPRKILLVSNSPLTSIDTIRNRLQEFGSIEQLSTFMLQGNTKKFFSVIFQENHSADALLKKKFFFAGQDLVSAQKQELGGIKTRQKSATMKLSNLPLTTTDWQLSQALTEVKAQFWRVPFSKNGKRIPICFVNFENEEDLMLAKKVKLKLRGQELHWSSPGEKLCDRCLSTNHDFQNCKLYVSAFRIQKNATVTNTLSSSPVSPNISYSSILKSNNEHEQSMALKKKQYDEMKAMNDLLEEEINRTMRLRKMQADLENMGTCQVAAIPSVSGATSVVQEQKLLDLEAKLGKIEALLTLQMQRDPTNHPMSQQEDNNVESDTNKVRLLGIEKSLGGLKKLITTQVDGKSPRRRIVRK